MKKINKHLREKGSDRLLSKMRFSQREKQDLLAAGLLISSASAITFLFQIAFVISLSSI